MYPRPSVLWERGATEPVAASKTVARRILEFESKTCLTHRCPTIPAGISFGHRCQGIMSFGHRCQGIMSFGHRCQGIMSFGHRCQGIVSFGPTHLGWTDGVDLGSAPFEVELAPRSGAVRQGACQVRAALRKTKHQSQDVAVFRLRPNLRLRPTLRLRPNLTIRWNFSDRPTRFVWGRSERFQRRIRNIPVREFFGRLQNVKRQSKQFGVSGSGFSLGTECRGSTNLPLFFLTRLKGLWL